MPRVIMKIPNQKFHFMEDWDIDDNTENIKIGFSKPHTGTLFVTADMVEEDEDALVFFGVPDGESEGKIAFWEHSQSIVDAWDKMIEVKQGCLKEDK